MSVFLTALGLCVPGAGHCDDLGLCEPTGLGIELELSLEASGYDASASGDRCDFEGIGLDLGWQHPWVALDAGLTFWTIGRLDERANGIGDLRLAVDATLARFDDARIAFGVGLSGTVPTGDVDLGTGSDHAMLMPSLWLRWRPDGASLGVRVAGHLMVSRDSPDHGAHGVALVDPMNHWGVAVGLEGNLRLHAHAWLTGGVRVDVSTDEGPVYAAASAGVRVPVGSVELGVDAEVPFGDDPRFIRGRASIKLGF